MATKSEIANLKFSIAGSLTQSAIDGFVTAGFATGLVGDEGYGWQIESFDVELPAPPSPLVNFSQNFGFSRQSGMTAVPNLLDDNLLTMDNVLFRVLTSGAYVGKSKFNVPVTETVIIAETMVYAFYRTSGFSAVTTYNFRLNLQAVPLTIEQRLAILSSRLP